MAGASEQGRYVSSAGSPPRSGAVRQSKVLVIDDEIENGDALARSLVLDGFVVECARTGAEGFARARANRPDAIVLDLHLPDVLGLTVLSDLRRANVDAPVVAVTGWYLDTDHDQAATALGAVAFLYKPIDAQELSVALRLALCDPRSRAVTRPDPASQATLLRPAAPITTHQADALACLHSRLIHGEADAVERIFAILLPDLRRTLTKGFRRVPTDWIHDSVVDALLEYYRNPARFDPARGVPLSKWLEYPARRNLVNRMDLERRRQHHEVAVPDRDLEAYVPRLSPCRDRRDFVNLIRSLLVGLSAVERIVFRVWSCEERRTFVFSRELELTDRPQDEQRAAVKRIKDRVLKRLRRQLATTKDKTNS